MWMFDIYIYPLDLVIVFSLFFWPLGEVLGIFFAWFK